MAYLILIRHGQSLWNAKGMWTGLIDIPLNEIGKHEAKKAGEAIFDMHIDACFTSKLKRAQETLAIIKHTLHLEQLPTTETPALNERDYGEFAGKNKWQIKQEYGEEQFLAWRRGWNIPIPGGETLEDVYNRVVPYYKEFILPLVKSGKNVLVVAHGNSLRALAKYIEHISDEEITRFEINTGEILLYSIDQDGKIIKKEKRAVNPNKV